VGTEKNHHEPDLGNKKDVCLPFYFLFLLQDEQICIIPAEIFFVFLNDFSIDRLGIERFSKC
jgi:hypothetical protein